MIKIMTAAKLLKLLTSNIKNILFLTVTLFLRKNILFLTVTLFLRKNILFLTVTLFLTKNIFIFQGLLV